MYASLPAGSSFLLAPALAVGYEGFFFNGSSFAVTSAPLELSSASALVGFSFRACSPGELLRQTGAQFDQLQLRLDPSGRLVFSLDTSDKRTGLSSKPGLLDAKWHTVSLSATADGGLTLTVDGEVVSARSGAELNGLLSEIRLASAQLRVGAGLVGCIREGPGVRLDSAAAGIAVNSVAVRWGDCPLPSTCAGEGRGKWTSTGSWSSFLP